MTTVLVPSSALLRMQGWIGGEWVDADSGETFAVTNPATGEELARVPRMGAAETRRALEAAEAAFPAGAAALPPTGRGSCAAGPT
jgi:succinate-semialdehyde dehydrogenase/glutarate-semialdehyde dehydrogenase